MITVRSIIVEALDRANLCSRRQSAPADMTETAYRFLRGIASKYSNDNLLQFIVAECGGDLTKREFCLGETDPSAPGEYEELDIPAPKIQKVNRMYWRRKDSSGIGTYVELLYVSPDDFDAYPDGTGVYTCQPLNDLQVILRTKLLPDPGTEFKVMYNKKWDFDLDTDLRIPEQYEELFITALTHKLALARPRLSTEQVRLLKEELDSMESNVKTSSRAVKYLSRRVPVNGISRTAFLNGTMFLGG